MSKATRKQRRKGRAAQPPNVPNPASTQPVAAQASAPQETPEPTLSAAELAAYFSNIAAPAGMNDASRANFEIAFAEREAAKRAETANSVDPSSDPNSPPSPDPSPRGGPSTQAGKARSAQNSFKHGLSSGFNHFRLLSSEDPAEYAELVSDIRAQFRPGSRPEVHKLEDMAQAWWLQRLDAQLASLREVQHRLQETMSGSAARSALASFLLAKAGSSFNYRRADRNRAYKITCDRFSAPAKTADDRWKTGRAAGI